MGLIAIEGMRFYAHHGYFAHENTIGGSYEVDAYIKTDFTKAAKTDELDGTINYSTVFDICEAVMKLRMRLIERIADEILQRTLKEVDGQIEHILIRVSKFNPPVGGEVRRTYVEVSYPE